MPKFVLKMELPSHLVDLTKDYIYIHCIGRLKVEKIDNLMEDNYLLLSHVQLKGLFIARLQYLVRTHITKTKALVIRSGGTEKEEKLCLVVGTGAEI